MQRHTGLIILLLALAGASWWLAQEQEESAIHTSFDNASDVDYYLRDFTAVTMQLNGQPGRTLYAQEVHHLFDTGLTHLKQPVLLVHQQHQPPWRIQSESGEIPPEGDWVLLHGEVNITRQAALPAIRPVQLQTRNVRVRPDQAYMETDESVTLYSQQDWLQAVGLRAWLHQPISIQLLQRVKSFYAPPA